MRHLRHRRLFTPTAMVEMSKTAHFSQILPFLHFKLPKNGLFITCQTFAAQTFFHGSSHSLNMGDRRTFLLDLGPDSRSRRQVWAPNLGSGLQVKIQVWSQGSRSTLQLRTPYLGSGLQVISPCLDSRFRLQVQAI